MDKLKKKIIKYFVLFACCLSVVEALWEGALSGILFSMLGSRKPPLLFVPVMFLVECSVFIVFAYLFYHFVSKAIAAESKRQISKRNMQYSRICHDLKTPMTSVQGFAAALRDGKIRPEEQDEIFHIIYSKSCYMNELVESLFAYSKLDTDDYQLSRKKLDMCSLVRNLVAMNYNEFDERDMELQLDIPDDPLFCYADEKEMKRSISNLIINTYKHNPNGTKALIQVYCHKKDAYVVVADSGDPIPPEQERFIFEPFMCGDEARTSGNGSGLGLAISQIIVRKHGGDLYISKDIDGCTKGFVIKLPVKALP